MNRITLLDSVRGFLLVLMAVDHLPGPHRVFTYEAFGLLSAAEGFVFLAGLVSALYSAHLFKKGGMELVFTKMHQRSRLIYCYHVLLLLFLVLFGEIVRTVTSHVYGTQALSNPNYYSNYFQNAFLPFYTQPVWATLLSVLLAYQPPLLDILPLYCVLQFLAPYILTLLMKGHMWPLLMGSISFWILAQFQMSQEMLAWVIPPSWNYSFWVFDPFAWQLIYILGFICGFLRGEDGAFYFSKFIPWLGCASLVMVVIGLYARYEVVTPPEIYNPLMHRSWLAPFRLLNALALFYLISRMTQLWPDFFNNAWLGRLGRYSLAVFSYHLVVIYLCDFLCERLLLLPFGWVGVLGVALVLVISLAIPVRISEAWKGSPS